MGAFLEALMNLNTQQKNLIWTSLFGSTGPIAWVLTKKLGLDIEEAKIWLDMLAVLTPAIAGIIIPVLATSQRQLDAIKSMSPEDKAKALANVSPETKVQAAASVPGTTVIVDPRVAPLAATAVAQDPDQPNVVATGVTK